MKSVQTILVTHHGSHLETIHAVATASARSLHLSGDPARADQHPWREWLEGAYTKVVKRTSEAKIRGIHAELGGTLGQDPHTGFTVCALPPMDDTPEHRRRLPGQLSIERSKPEPQTELPPGCWIVLHGELGMSTGKASAQAAHAHTLAALQGFALDPDVEVAWASAALFRHLQGREADVMVRVRDNGLTEIPEGASTALLVETRDVQVVSR